jgi:hypothetical protein
VDGLNYTGDYSDPAVVGAALGYLGGYLHRTIVGLAQRPRKRAPMELQPVDPRAWAMLEDRGPDSLDFHVRKLMKDLGLKGYHARNSIGSPRGWPDWVIWNPHGGRPPLFRELKTEQGRLTVEQRQTGSELRQSGMDWTIWRPRDLFTGVIVKQLRGLTL